MSDTDNQSKDIAALPHPLGVAPQWIDSAGRKIALHVSRPARIDLPTVPPLVLVHSVNAGASAVEMHSLFRRQAQSQNRAVVALDLPGFGASERTPGHVTPATMARAISDSLEWTQRHVAPGPADVVALSLGCEFATLAALSHPRAVRSLALISPTGMERRRIGEPYVQGGTRRNALVAAMLALPGAGRALHTALGSRLSTRWLLARTWGTPLVDESLLAHAEAHSRVTGSHHAASDLLSGSLFTRGIVSAYPRLDMPVLVAHGRRGKSTDFEAYGHVASRGSASWQRRIFDTGGMPHLEWPSDFEAAYQSWLTGHVVPWAASPMTVLSEAAKPKVSEAMNEVSRIGRRLGSPSPVRAGAPLAGAG